MAIAESRRDMNIVCDSLTYTAAAAHDVAMKMQDKKPLPLDEVKALEIFSIAASVCRGAIAYAFNEYLPKDFGTLHAQAYAALDQKNDDAHRLAAAQLANRVDHGLRIQNIPSYRVIKQAQEILRHCITRVIRLDGTVGEECMPAILVKKPLQVIEEEMLLRTHANDGQPRLAETHQKEVYLGIEHELFEEVEERIEQNIERLLPDGYFIKPPILAAAAFRQVQREFLGSVMSPIPLQPIKLDS